MIDRVVDAFDRWLADRASGGVRNSDALDVVRMACELKAMYFEPNPADWPADIAAEVVGEVMPSKVIGVDAEFIESIIPAMQTYLDFLVLTGRWKGHNDERATRSALTRLGDLAPRFGDTGRQSMAGRVMQLAVDEGIDISDPGAVADFMQRFNEMPFEWRKRLTDDAGGALFDDDDLDDDLLDRPTDPIERDLQAGIGAALAALVPLVSVRPDLGAAVTVPAADEEWAALAGTTLIARVLDLAEWVYLGRAVTSTGALRLDDMKWWCAQWELPAGHARARSMWDVPGIALPWRIALDCGVIEIAGNKVGPGEQAFDGPVQDRVRLGRELVRRLLDFVLVPMDIHGDLLNAVNFVMLPMLMSMCVPPGQELAGLNKLSAVGNPSEAESFYPRLVTGYVRADIDMLRDWGVIVESADRAIIPAALRAAVVETINSPLAPFRISLKAGAVPVADPVDIDD